MKATLHTLILIVAALLGGIAAAWICIATRPAPAPYVSAPVWQDARRAPRFIIRKIQQRAGPVRYAQHEGRGNV